MEKIFDHIEEINKKSNFDRKEKKISVFNCYFCDEKTIENNLTYKLFVDNEIVYICDKCIKDNEIKKYEYCHNCGIDIEKHSYYCTKCPEDVNILCSKCHKLHDILINSKH